MTVSVDISFREQKPGTLKKGPHGASLSELWKVFIPATGTNLGNIKVWADGSIDPSPILKGHFPKAVSDFRGTLDEYKYYLREDARLGRANIPLLAVQKLERLKDSKPSAGRRLRWG